MKTAALNPPARKYWNSPLPASPAVPRYVRSMAWFLSSVFAVWIVASLCLEFRLGLPTTRAEWGYRTVGWFVNAVLIRTFLRGLRRLRAAPAD